MNSVDFFEVSKLTEGKQLSISFENIPFFNSFKDFSLRHFPINCLNLIVMTGVVTRINQQWHPPLLGEVIQSLWSIESYSVEWTHKVIQVTKRLRLQGSTH